MAGAFFNLVFCNLRHGTREDQDHDPNFTNTDAGHPECVVIYSCHHPDQFETHDFPLPLPPNPCRFPACRRRMRPRSSGAASGRARGCEHPELRVAFKHSLRRLRPCGPARAFPRVLPRARGGSVAGSFNGGRGNFRSGGRRTVLRRAQVHSLVEVRSSGVPRRFHKVFPRKEIIS